LPISHPRKENTMGNAIDTFDKIGLLITVVALLTLVML
jgi:hypothetical protein